MAIPATSGCSCPYSHGSNPGTKPPEPETKRPESEGNPPDPNNKRPLTQEEQDLLDGAIKALGLSPEQEKIVRDNLDPETIANILAQNKNKV